MTQNVLRVFTNLIAEKLPFQMLQTILINLVVHRINHYFRHAAPTGKACTAGAGVQDLEKEKNGGKSVSRGQGPNHVGFDALDEA